MTTPRLVSIGGQVVDLLALPKVTITTVGGAPILNTEDYVSGTVTITGPGAVATRNTQIRGRGNSTWAAAKKPYRLKLSSAASLVPGLAADRDWVLLAAAYDPAYVRTWVATEIGNRCTGLAWTPQFRFVELTLNGQYAGLYLLGEHVKVDGDRIDIDDPDDATSGLALTGGYTLEIDQRLEANNEPGFRSALTSLPFAMDEPDDTVPAQKAYIQDWINDFEAVLYGDDWLDPTTGYARFIDRDSFIDWYLVNELCANLDSNFFSSCKLYKTRDTASEPGRLYFGPLWDFDNSLGNSFRGDWPVYTGFWTREASEGGFHPGALWFTRLFEDPAFAAAAWARWQALVVSLADLPALIDYTMQRVWQAAYRDLPQWGLTVNRVAETERITNFLEARIAWLNTALAP